MATTGTMFTHSRTSFDTWSTFIAGELNGLTLEQQKVATELSIVTCFNMRHKLYKAISKVQEIVVLSGDVELDPSYTNINLISTRHLQVYLDWIVFKKKLKYTLDMRKWKSETYMESTIEQIPFICRDIVKLPMPIDLYTAYREYHYGIFANIN